MTFFSLREKHFQIQTNKHKPNTKFYFQMSYFIIAQMPPQKTNLTDGSLISGPLTSTWKNSQISHMSLL